MSLLPSVSLDNPHAQRGVVFASSILAALPHLIVAFVIYPRDEPPDGRLGGPGFGMNYVMTGRGTYRDAAGREHALLPGSLYFRCGRYAHETTWDRAEPVSEYLLCFSRLTYEHLEPLGLVAANAPPVLQLGPRKRVVERYENFIGKFAEAKEDDAPALLREIVGFLAEIREMRLETPPAHPHMDLVERARRAIEARPADRSDLTHLASELGVSYSLLRKAFRQITGQSLSDFRVHSRVQQARLLLDRHSVQEVAEILGYGDPFAFSKQFKGVVGISPKQFQMLYYR